MRRLFTVLALAAGLAGRAAAQFHLDYDPASRVWTIENGQARAVFQLTSTGTFEFRSLADQTTGDTWTPPEGTRSSPIRLVVDGQPIDADSSFNLVRQAARSAPRDSYRQTIVLDEAGGLGRVTLELEMYEGQPALRYRVRYQNLLGRDVTVRAADMLPWTFDDRGSTFSAFRVNQWVKHGLLGNFEPIAATLDPGGRPVAVEAGAYGQHCGWLALRDTADRGLFAGWEFDGRSSATLRHTASDSSLQLSAPVNDLNRPLAPNAQFQVPAAFLGVFRGDWDEAGYRTQRFAETALTREMPDAHFPYVMWDSWKYQTGIDEYTLRQNAEIAARIGVEVFVIDLGWARHIGDWRPDPRKFPSGLRALSDYVRSLGMKFGLHFALAEAAPESPVLLSHPDWTSTESYGYFEADSLCLSHRPVRDWLIGEAVRIIDQYGVDWILQDGENMVKRCMKTTHTHAPLDSNYSNAVDGLNAVITAVQNRRPAVHWENCEDGGNMMTFNMVRNYVTSIAADDSGPMTTRQAVYGITYPFSPRYSDRYMADEELGIYITRSFMFGGPWIFMNRLIQMRPEDIELATSEIELFKKLRIRIRDGRVFHLTARPAETRIDALESYHEASDSALAFVYRAQAAANSYRLRPRGLKPDNTYRVRFQEDRRLLTMTGQQLMEGGVRVNLPVMWSTEIVYIDPRTAPR